MACIIAALLCVNQQAGLLHASQEWGILPGHPATISYNPGLFVQLALFLGFLYPCYASYKALLTPGTADDHQVRPSSPKSCYSNRTHCDFAADTSRGKPGSTCSTAAAHICPDAAMQLQIDYNDIDGDLMRPC